MLFTEFNMEDALDVRYDEGVQAGMQAGMQTGAKQKAEEISVYVDELSLEEIEALKCNLSDNEIN